jgi:uridine kinase
MDDMEAIVGAIPVVDRPVLIAIDGVDGSGKTRFAERLAAVLNESARTSIVVHEDDFMNPRAVRFRLGRDAPEGFFRDSYDLDALRHRVLSPLAEGGGRKIVRRVFDYHRDAVVTEPAVEVPSDGVVIVEGLFLHRDELISRWDLSVFLDVPFTETARRMAERDGSHHDPEHPSMRRYIEGQRIYLARCRPREQATIVVDNSDFRIPRVVVFRS